MCSQWNIFQIDFRPLYDHCVHQEKGKCYVPVCQAYVSAVHSVASVALCQEDVALSTTGYLIHGWYVPQDILRFLCSLNHIKEGVWEEGGV